VEAGVTACEGETESSADGSVKDQIEREPRRGLGLEIPAESRFAVESRSHDAGRNPDGTAIPDRSESEPTEKSESGEGTGFQSGEEAVGVRIL
jgi:hypothetical protein